ncbi:hypothetical protein [Streptomyces sp. NPDC056405]|uniref:hypothetical protein n=1 Tax=Streptomyces sp. NPDC056405 TaxID=3345811 RepID=UPI0035D80874
MTDQVSRQESAHLTIYPPSTTAAALAGLALVYAADLAGALPEDPAMGWMLAAVTVGALAKHCVRRSR